MATKKIEIIYDINGKAIDVAIDKTLNLKQTVRELTKELNKTGQSSQNIQILSKSLNDAKDKMQGVKAKSSEFFNTLSLLPGPIGQFSNSIDGAIGLLKTFSSFKLSDIKSQFKGLGEDIMGIVNALLGLSDKSIETSASLKETQESTQKVDEVTKSTTQSTNNLSEATKNGAQANKENSKTLAETAQQQGTLAASVQRTTTDFNKYFNLVKTGNGLQLDRKKSLVDMTEAEREASKVAAQNYINEVKSGNIKIKAIQQTEAYTQAQVGQKFALNTTTGALEIQTAATVALTFAQKAATFATNALKIAIVGLGIGAFIILIQAIVERVSEWASKTKEAEKATSDFNDELKRQAELLKESQSQVDFEIKKAELIAQIAGKSEDELFQIKKKGLENKKGLLTKELDDAIQLQRDLANQDVTKMTQAQAKARLDMIDANREKIIKLREDESRAIEAIELAGLENDNKIQEKKRAEAQKNGQKLIEINKTTREKILADNRTADEALLKLLQETAVLFITDKRKREDEELKIAMENEERIINNLKISEEKKGIIRLQIFVKYGLKVLDINNKRVEEDKKSMEDEAKQLRDFNKKKQEILDNATAEQVEKLKNQRKTKYEDDLMTLEKDKEFIKLEEDEKKKLRIALRTAYDNDVKKIDEDEKKRLSDERLKKIDDELKYLQLKGETIRQGSKESWQLQFDQLKLQEQREIEAADGKEKEITRIQEEYAKKRKKLKQDENIAVIAAVGETIAAIGNVTSALAANYDEEAKTSKEAFEKRKKLQLATAYMSAASGVIQILTQPSTLPSPFDWIVKGVNAAALLIATNAQIKSIKATKFEGSGGKSPSMGKNYADGGYIDGPRHSQGGVPITAEGGEAIMTRGAVTMFQPLLSMMNQAGGGTSFTKGAVGSASYDNPQTQINQMEQPIIKTYVVENELTTIQHRAARLKDLSTL